MFQKVLVANRGEIACRVMRTCRDLGLSTVAVYSDADAGEPHVRLADEAVRIGPPPVRESYLDAAAILHAARRTGAEAIHPGYGFLSENADFAQDCLDEGLIFVGPRPETIRAMGSKAGARALMAGHGVPVVPGHAGADQSDEALIAAAERIGFPVLVKASAGGGGKGMSIVGSAAEMPTVLAQARRVAQAAFGDATLLLERYIERPRHVEVQIFGDTHGHVVHLFERECSVQRRFQKIIEESPSPARQLTPAIREALCEAGVTAAKAIGYVGAGTIEFLLDQQGGFYFLEVNTRLQVEHPVTEMITGLDLVRLQLLVAQGLSLEGLLPRLERRGHAIEARLYAEDPANEFLPATGRLLEWDVPHGPGLRFDAGVARGSNVDIYYDPLLAKAIAWGPTRQEAILRLRGALGRLGVQGVTTNVDFLRATLGHAAFVAGDTHTHFIQDHFPAESRRFPVPSERLHEAACVAALVAATRHRAAALVPSVRPGFRNNPGAPQWVEFEAQDTTVRVEYEALSAEAWRVRIAGTEWRRARVEAGEGWRIGLEDRVRTYHVVTDGAVHGVRGPDFAVRLTERPRFPERASEAKHGGCEAPMPGRVVQVLVKPGELVGAGTPLVILEAMKMEQFLTAAAPAVVERVCVAPGDRVEAGTVLVELGPANEP